MEVLLEQHKMLPDSKETVQANSDRSLKRLTPLSQGKHWVSCHISDATGFKRGSSRCVREPSESLMNGL